MGACSMSLAGVLVLCRLCDFLQRVLVGYRRERGTPIGSFFFSAQPSPVLMLGCTLSVFDFVPPQALTRRLRTWFLTVLLGRECACVGDLATRLRLTVITRTELGCAGFTTLSDDIFSSMVIRCQKVAVWNRHCSYATLWFHSRTTLE